MDESDKKSASTKQGGKRSQKRNQDEDYLTEDLKKEVDECSPMEGDRDQETGCLSAAGLLRLKNICEILFKKGQKRLRSTLRALFAVRESGFLRSGGEIMLTRRDLRCEQRTQRCLLRRKAWH